MTLHSHSTRKMPLSLSTIAAGPTSEVVDDFELLDLNEVITHGREGFIAFEVTGDSMVAEIHPGNLIFVDSWAAPENGDIVAASVNGQTCVKFFKRTNQRLYLVPANSSYPSREITQKDNFRVLGVVKGHLAVYRK